MASSSDMPEIANARMDAAATGAFAWGRHRRYVLFMVFVAFFLNALDRNIINVLQQPIKTEFHLMDWQLGMMTGLAFAVLYNLVGIPTARFIDGGAIRRDIMAGGLALWSVATALCGVTQNFWQLLLCRMGVGVGEGTFGPSTMTLISDYYGPNERARAMGLYLLGLPLASFIGMPLGGWVAQHYGWRAALMLVGLPGLAVALIIRLAMREPPRGLSDGVVVKVSAALPIHHVFATVTKKKTVVHLLAAASLASFSTVGGMVWLPPYLQRAFGLNVAEVSGTWGVMSGLAGALGAFGGGWLADRYGIRSPKYYMLLPGLAMGVSLPLYLLALMSGSFPLCLACLIVPATLSFSWIPAGIAVTQSLAPMAMRALLGMFVTLAANLIGQGIAPPAIGALSDVFTDLTGSDVSGLRWALVASAIFYPWSAFHFWLASRNIREDLEA
ncbi:MAG TPA: MFS transporter [Alphaproteobacteria bacterium]|nr:MFS transporter [Alphaproteobacteria bacterium]